MDVERLDADETPGPTSQACLLRAYVKPFLGIFRVRQLVRLDAQQIADVQVDSRVCRQQTPVSPPHLPPDTVLPRAAPPMRRERALRRAEPRQRLRDGLRMMSSGMGRRWLRLFLSMRMREGFTAPGQLWRQLLGPEPARNVVGMGAAAGRGGLNKRQKMRRLTWSRISRPFLSSSCFSSCRRKTSES